MKRANQLKIYAAQSGQYCCHSAEAHCFIGERTFDGFFLIDSVCACRSAHSWCVYVCMRRMFFIIVYIRIMEIG